MKALIYIAFANVLLVGQTLSPADRVEQSSKRFRPELTVPITPPATLFQSTCVYRSPDTKSLSVQPCRKDSRKLRLMPPSPTKPTVPRER
jgi:hypothetical protein